MTMSRPFLTLGLAALLATGTAADDAEPTRTVAQPRADLFETARAAGGLELLLQAFERAGLTAELRARGPVTLFAPTDAAIRALDEETRAVLAGERDTTHLRRILRHHLVAGLLDTDDLKERGAVRSAEGPRLRFTVRDGLRHVDGVPVKAKSIPATNGVLHLIDGVLLPPRDDLVAALEADGRFSWFTRGLREAGMAAFVGGTRPLTVFAPTDEHFRPMVEPLLARGYHEAVRRVLRRHIAAGRLYADQLTADGAAASLDGGALHVARGDGGRTVTGVPLIDADHDALNGTIHALGGILPAATPR